MSYDPKDYHFNSQRFGSGLLLAAVIFCGMGMASMDVHGTAQRSLTATAGDAPSAAIVQCIQQPVGS